MILSNIKYRLGIAKSLIVITLGIGSLVGITFFQSDILSAKNETFDFVNESSGSDIRIATLLPFAADQLIQMGVRPVCVPALRGDKNKSWEGIPTVQLDHSAGPNLEQLISVNPQYIITATTYSQFMDRIEKITNSKVIYMDVNSVDSVYRHIEKLGEISGQNEKADSMVQVLKDKLENPLSFEVNKAINVLAIFGTPHSFYAFLPDSFLGDLVTRAGGKMGPEGLTSHKIYRGLAPLSMETVIEYDPDLLFVVFHGNQDASSSMFQGDPLWSSLKAVSEDRIFFLDEDRYTMRPGSDLNDSVFEIKEYVQIISNRSK